VVHDPEVADVVRVDRDAGRVRVGRVDLPAAQRRARKRVLEDLERATVHDPEGRAVGHDVLGVGVAVPALNEVEAAGRILAAGEAAGGGGVPVHGGRGAIHQPNVGAVGGDTGERRRRTQAAGRPGAEQGAAGVVDVDVLVRVHDPFGGAGRGSRDAAR